MATGQRFSEADLDRLTALVRAIRDGDRAQRSDAVVGLVGMIDGWLLASFHKARVAREHFEDLQHSVVLKILQSAAAYRDGAVISWLLRLVRSVVVDHLRSRQAQGWHPLPEDDVPPAEVLGAVAWDAWLGAGVEATGPDIARWSEGQRRLALEACIESHLQAFEADEPRRGAAVRLASLEGWSMKQVGEFLGKNENNARVYTRESRLKSASYFEDCLQFLEHLSHRQRGHGQAGSTP